jgi:hypothetical protein
VRHQGDESELNGKPEAPSIPEEFQFIESSQTGKLFLDLLETYYIPLEVWYARSIIEKVMSSFTVTCIQLRPEVGS